MLLSPWLEFSGDSYAAGSDNGCTIDLQMHDGVDHSPQSNEHKQMVKLLSAKFCINSGRLQI